MDDGIIEDSAMPSTKAASRRRATTIAASTAPVENVAIVEPEVPNDNVITGPPKPKRARKSNTAAADNGAIVSSAADRVFQNSDDSEPEEPVGNGRVALKSAKNVRWGTFGSLVKGYNIVTEEAAEKWLTISGVEKATPEEVAAHYGL